MKQEYPYLLNREQASRFIGIDPKSFDRYIRPYTSLKRFMIGSQERFTIDELKKYIQSHYVN
ncbi:helix-turn-helix domain-containing protein [Pseudolactococcus yaeyamensis]